MEVFLVYLWLKLDSITVALYIVAGVLALAVPFVYAVGYPDGCYQETKKAYKAEHQNTRNRCFTIGVICGVLALLLPGSKDTAILVATHYAGELVRSPEGTKVLTLARKKANEYLDAAIKP
jgi:hypothetical protein